MPTEPDQNLSATQSSPESAPHSLPWLASTPLAKRRVAAVLVSIGLHGSVLVILALAGRAARNKLVAPTDFQRLAMVEVAGGSHAVKFLLPPMDMAAKIHDPDKDPEVSRQTILPIPQNHPKVSGGGAPISPHKGNGSGQALTGNGSDAEDARPAFPVFSPHPPVSDRRLLPATEKKIVVDVKLDAQGQVLSETLVQGMGNELDQIVLDIARTWRFQPATVNGKPVPSEAELIFPFNSSYPITES
ncbi:MAG: TonB family protein [Terracidiphilus sp.]